MRKTESQKIALCGMLGALSVVLLLIGSALQIGTYAAPMLAAFLIIPVLEEYGPRYALTLYATVSILAVLFVPETELAFFYVLVMGYSMRPRCWCICCCSRCWGLLYWTSCWPTERPCWWRCWPREICHSGCATGRWRR